MKIASANPNTVTATTIQFSGHSSWPIDTITEKVKPRADSLMLLRRRIRHYGIQRRRRRRARNRISRTRRCGSQRRRRWRAPIDTNTEKFKPRADGLLLLRRRIRHCGSRRRRRRRARARQRRSCISRS